jgi:hypothetical protein
MWFMLAASSSMNMNLNSSTCCSQVQFIRAWTCCKFVLTVIRDDRVWGEPRRPAQIHPNMVCELVSC